MSRCSNCGCDLSNLQTLCQECYDERYSRIGQSQKSISFRRRLTGRNVLIFLFVFAYGFLLFRTRRFHLDPYAMTTKASALIAFACASIAFYVESSRRK
jgi:hypothetical protein